MCSTEGWGGVKAGQKSTPSDHSCWCRFGGWISLDVYGPSVCQIAGVWRGFFLLAFFRNGMLPNAFPLLGKVKISERFSSSIFWVVRGFSIGVEGMTRVLGICLHHRAEHQAK